MILFLTSAMVDNWETKRLYRSQVCEVTVMPLLVACPTLGYDNTGSSRPESTRQLVLMTLFCPNTY